MTKQERTFRCIDKKMPAGLSKKQQVKEFCILIQQCGKKLTRSEATKKCNSFKGDSAESRYERCVLHVKQDIWDGKADVNTNPYAVCHASIG